MNLIEARLSASQIASGNTMDGNLLYMVLCAIYLSGVAVVVLITAASFVRMWQYIYTVPPTLIDDFKVRIVDMDTPSFSWGRNIVISRKDVGENPNVLIHEKMHAGCMHSLDLTLFSFVVIVHWFNPLVWIARGELKMLHEYEADKLTIDSGIDASQYQLLLVKKAVGEKRFHLANGFNHSKLKTRIKMIGRSDTKGWVRLAYILFIPLLFAVMCCCTQKSLNHGIVPLSEIYQQPIFEGGDANTFSRWVNQQLRYPKNAMMKISKAELLFSLLLMKSVRYAMSKFCKGFVRNSIMRRCVSSRSLLNGLRQEWSLEPPCLCHIPSR